ncbi:MAG TPA: S8 family serine peptidase [Chitinophagales bacterium]|nr:S8 family serine peptidase [Chitinophagales bacterium]
MLSNKFPLLLLFCVTSKIVSSQTFDTSYVDGALYAKVRDTATATFDLGSPPLNLLVPIYGLDTLYWPFKGYNTYLDNIYRLEFTNISQTNQLIAALQAIPSIEFAEKVPLGKTESFVPDDLNANQWYLSKINAELAWSITTGSSQVVVAIIDNGVKLSHEDLAANMYVNAGEIPNNLLDDDLNGYRDDVNGFDVADMDNNANPPPTAADTNGFRHGTLCAGIASAVTNNSKGIASIGFSVKIMPVKCTRNNVGNSRAITHPYEGVFYAMRAGADVISMSFGGEGHGFTDQAVINAASNEGIVLVAAAGNANTNTPFFPAAFPNVISVGATDFNDQKASFSNFGTWVDLMAPGVSIFSTLVSTNSSYGSLSGTSMACPLVAGLAGLVLSVKPDFTPAQVATALTNGCDDISLLNPAFTGQIGAGRINALKTLSQITGVTPDSCGFVNSPNINSSFTFSTSILTATFTNQSTDYCSSIWHFGDGDSSLQQDPQHVYLLPGNYTVSLKVMAGSSSDVSQQQVMVGTVGIDTELQSVKIIPNPLANVLDISVVDASLRLITITDISGKIVIQSSSPSIPFDGMGSGLYFLNVRLLNGKSIAKKIMVNP